MQSRPHNSEKIDNAHKWLKIYFNTISHGEITLEYLRTSLFKHIKKFPDLIKELDLSQKGYLTSEDIWNFMKRYKIKCSSAHAYSLIKLYDSDGDGKLSENDILFIISPCILKAKQKSEDKLGNYGIALLFSMLLEKEIELINKLSDIAEKLNELNLSAFDVFSLVVLHSPKNEQNSFNSLCLLEYFLINHADTTVDSVDLIIRRLDRDKDNKVSYMDFMNSIYFHSILILEKYRSDNSEKERHTNNLIEEIQEKTPPPKRKPEIPVISGTKYSYKKLNGKHSKSQGHTKKAFKQKLHLSDLSPNEKDIEKPYKKIENEKILEMVKTLMNSIKKLEKEKQELAQRIDFTYTKAWKILEPNLKTEKIDAETLKNKFLDLGVKYELIKNIPILLKILKIPDNILTKTVFSNSLLSPQKKSYRNLIKIREKIEETVPPLKNKLGQHTRKTLCWVFELALEYAGIYKEISENFKKLVGELGGKITREKVF